MHYDISMYIILHIIIICISTFENTDILIFINGFIDFFCDLVVIIFF